MTWVKVKEALKEVVQLLMPLPWISQADAQRDGRLMDRYSPSAPLSPVLEARGGSQGEGSWSDVHWAGPPQRHILDSVCLGDTLESVSELRISAFNPQCPHIWAYLSTLLFGNY